MMCPGETSPSGRTSIWAVLSLTFLVSLGTGVFWSGLPFIAEHDYGFSQTRNLILCAYEGLIYTIGAFSAGWISRRISRRLTARSVLRLCVALQAIACLAPVVFDGEWALWFTAGVVNLLSSQIWPLVESYLTASRHGPQMRGIIGWWNVTWMSATAIAMLAIAPLMEEYARWAIGGMGAINALALLTIIRFPSRPGQHDEALAQASMTPEYPYLLRSARVLLPLSYVIQSAMTPLLPYLLDDLSLGDTQKTPATATWMIARVLVVAIMWRIAFWHGRWGTLLLGAVSMLVGFGLIVLAPTLLVMLSGFVLIGAGLGILYYAALYYAMAVGRAKIEASGRHEGLIGAGYSMGPAAGLAGATAGGGKGIVGVVWGVVGLGLIAAVQPYLKARKLREGIKE